MPSLSLYAAQDTRDKFGLGLVLGAGEVILVLAESLGLFYVRSIEGQHLTIETLSLVSSLPRAISKSGVILIVNHTIDISRGDVEYVTKLKRILRYSP